LTVTAISLGGSWTLHDAAGTAVCPCPVPGDVHTALIIAGRIPDPMAGTNEADIQWVAEAEWELRHAFDAPPLAGRWAILDLEFLDTIADVTLNGVAVARLDSSFIRHRIDVSAALKAGRNDIAVRFRSAVAEAKRIAATQPFPIPYSVSNNRVSDLNMLRKAQCHGGWDWGPCIMALGIYAEPTLHLFDGARIESAVVRQEHRADGSVRAVAEVELAARDPVTVPVTFTLAGETVTMDVAVSPEHGGRASLAVDVAAPDLWWPAGHGAQPLHEAVVSIPGDRMIRRIGFRTVEIVNRPDAGGMSMGVRVNGRDIFARGANWIPADALPARITPERIRRLLAEAVAANMNMIRVWGGGFYEFDAFYDACDELGLMVWQDMMFACSQYPSTPEFLAKVDAEVRYQVKRLASRPSIVLWCGDNEVIGSLTWYDLSKNNRDRYLVNYDRLNRVIEQAVTESDAGRKFWPSSPCSGTLDYGDAWHRDSSGDMHFWSVWHENRDFEHYYDVRPRFCSEFGFQSFPTMHVIRRFADEKDWNATSPVMEFHQRDKAGNGRTIETMARYFRVPSTFAGFLYLSQLQQALAIETAVRFWRSLKPHTMGTLYWQLNDVWPAISWSSLDHAIGWKTLHYHARRFYRPLALAPRIDHGRLIVSAVNDGNDAAPLEVSVRRIAMDGHTLDTTPLAAAVPADRAVELGSVPVPGEDDFFFLVEGRSAGAADFDPAMRVTIFPRRPKTYDLPDTRVTLASAGEPGIFTVAADKPAFFIKPEAAEFAGAFDDGSFTLLPGETRTLRFRSFDGRMPGLADVALAHLGGTYR
jgi:beta-mannosidase